VSRVLVARAALLLWAVAAFALLACGGENQPRLLFSSYSSQDRPGLFSVRADGSELTQVASLEVEGLAFPRVPSPDGMRLAFPCRPDRDQARPQTDLCLSAADGSDARVATEGKLPQSSLVSSDIVWAPDSRLLAFIVNLTIREGLVSPAGVYVLDADSGEVRRLVPGTTAVMQWSPDGRRLAFEAGDPTTALTALEVVDLKDDTLVDLTQQMEGQGLIESFAWSPDGSTIAFVREILAGPGRGVRLYTIAPDGSNLRQLPGNPDLWITPIWSPDGRWLAVRAAPAGRVGGVARIYIVPVSGGEPLLLAPDLVLSDYPVWSPDSRQLAFKGAESAADPNSYPPLALYVAGVESRELRQVAEDLQRYPLITWSPDGRRVLFTSQGGPCVEGCPSGFLFSVPADGSASPVQLTDFRVDTFVGWQP